MRAPLFPLNLVLFPGQMLPLHIFEDRYKQMLQRCLRERLPFGIVLIREAGRLGRSSPYSVGTFARVVQIDETPEGQCAVPQPHRGNCYHIVCRGDERFRTTALDRREADYLVADVDLMPDEPAPEAALMMVGQRVSTLFDEYYRNVIALMGGWQREATPGERTLMFDMAALAASQQLHGTETDPITGDLRSITVPTLPEDPSILANVVAAEMNIPVHVKQDLLEAPSALARLQREAELLAEEKPQIEDRLRQQYRRRFAAFGMGN